MEKKTIAEQSYIDIIFQNRNQAYGGYQLRKDYPSRLKTSLGLTLSGLAGFVCLSFVSINRETTQRVALDKPITTTCVIRDMTKKEVVPLKPTTPPPPSHPTNTKKFVTLVVAKDNDLPNEPIELPTNAQPGLTNTNIDSSSNNDSGPVGNGPKTNPAIVAEPPAVKRAVMICEQMPQFSGDLGDYLSKNLIYPEQARNNNIEGRVAIQFIINEDGSIEGAAVRNGIGYGCDEAALKVIAAMPKWKLGKNNGVPVKVLYTQPISFKLQ